MGTIICFGEVLWDVLPGGRKLGGAPLNVALRAQSWGYSAKMISSIGEDPAGEDLSREILKHGGSLEHIQIDANFPTSEVLVSLDESGSASYEIKKPCAWDNISAMERDFQAVETSDAFIYGSLVARSAVSRETLFALLERSAYRVFDVNLRPPHYTPDGIISLMKEADFVKFNDEELYEICSYLNYMDQDLESCIRFVAQRTGTKELCVTLGKEGGVLFANNEFFYNRGYKITVADTVGAGDSFLASIISQLLSGNDPQVALDFACAVGAIVASRSGANPGVSISEVREMMVS